MYARSERDVAAPGDAWSTAISSSQDNADRSTAERLLVPGIFITSLLTLLLTADALIRGRSEFDYRLIRAVQELDGPYFGTVLSFVDSLTSSFWAITLWSALLLYLAVVLRSWLPALTVGLIPLGGALNWIIRYVVDRPRPAPDELIRSQGELDAAAFPSGHVVGAVIFYGVIFLLARRIQFAPLRVGMQAFCVGVIVLAGPARVWLGAHWVSDVITAYVLGLAVLLALIWFYRSVAAAAGDLPFIHSAELDFDESIPQAHALTSTILFEGDVVTKIYAPGFVPRAVYWLSFQAEFPYIRNRDALEAAVLRRNLAGQLTEYWYGGNRVARAYGVVEVGGRLGLASELIETGGEQDSDAEIEFLHDLCARFDEAGLPTWQIDPRQPRGKDNVLRGKDGTYYIVDLESGLVSPLASPRAVWRALERADVPLFDTVYFDITRDYVENAESNMRIRMGDDWYGDLRALLDRAEAANAAWHAGEPRIWSRLLRWIESGFGLGRLIRRAREATSANLDRAEELLYGMVETWEAEERIDHAEAEAVRAALAEPQMHRVLPHFAVHLSIGIALRFPIGSIVRASYVLLNLLAATIRLLLRKIDRDEWRRDFSIHSPLVLLVAGMPGIGTFAYLLSGPIRSNHMLMRMLADTILLKIPGRIYERVGWRALVARPAGWAERSEATNADGVLRARTRRLAIALGGVGAALIVGHVLLELLLRAFDPEWQVISDIATLLGVDGPGTLPTAYSLTVLSAAGLLSLIAAFILGARRRDGLLPWGAPALVALAFAFEEHLGLSNPATKIIPELLEGDFGLVNEPWMLLWIPALAVAGIVSYRFIVALPLQLRGLIVIGILLYLGGAVGAEILGSLYRWIVVNGEFEYDVITSLEELAELLGIVVVAYVVLEYARLNIGTAGRDPDGSR